MLPGRRRPEGDGGVVGADDDRMQATRPKLAQVVLGGSQEHFGPARAGAGPD